MCREPFRLLRIVFLVEYCVCVAIRIYLVREPIAWSHSLPPFVPLILIPQIANTRTYLSIRISGYFFKYSAILLPTLSRSLTAARSVCLLCSFDFLIISFNWRAMLAVALPPSLSMYSRMKTRDVCSPIETLYFFLLVLRVCVCVCSHHTIHNQPHQTQLTLAFAVDEQF